MLIVDSDVWSEAFRKKGRESLSVRILRSLINDGEVLMIGLIRQEVLSGIKEFERFEKVALRAFPSQRIEAPIFELAASFFNLCRGNGIQGSHSDFLICACAMKWKTKILTKDKDFSRFAKYVPIELYRTKL